MPGQVNCPEKREVLEIGYWKGKTPGNKKNINGTTINFRKTKLNAIFASLFGKTTVRCQSGRTSKPGKFVYGQPYRGFESLGLRMINTKGAWRRLFTFLKC